MSDELLEELASVVVMSLSRCDIERHDRIQILEKALIRERRDEKADEAALMDMILQGAN